MNTAVSDDPYETDAQALPGKSIGDYVDVLRRRRAVALVSLVLLMLAALAVALGLPAVYRSSATILIKEQEIPQELVRSTVTSFADERIQVISQQVMTRATLLDLVDRHGLYGKARQRETSEEIIDRMRRDIKLTPISADVTDRRSGSQVRSTIAFTLSYDSENPASAQKIANELTTLFLNENVKIRQLKAAETTTFLDEELTRVSDHISEVEQRLSEFKQRNQGRTPDLSVSNQVNAERLASDLGRIEREISFQEDRKIQLESQLADTRPFMPLASLSGGAALEPDERLRQLKVQLTTLAGQYSDDHPDVRRLRREIATLQAETGVGTESADREDRLGQLKEQLSSLRQRYSDDHPDVVKLRRAYAAMEEAVRAAPKPAAATAGSGSRKPDNPVWVNLKAQVAGAQSQIEALRSERAELSVRLRQIDSKVAQMPEVEREYLELVRDLDSSRARFREMRDKQMQAQVAEQLERGRKAERFTIIEPPIFPERPYRPNRQLILLMGLLVAVAGSLSAVALREALDATVHGPRDVTRLMQVPVLGVLPAPVDPFASTRSRARLRLALVGILILGAAAAIALHLFYMPLDVAWYGLLRRLGS